MDFNQNTSTYGVLESDFRSIDMIPSNSNQKVVIALVTKVLESTFVTPGDIIWA